MVCTFRELQVGLAYDFDSPNPVDGWSARHAHVKFSACHEAQTWVWHNYILVLFRAILSCVGSAGVEGSYFLRNENGL